MLYATRADLETLVDAEALAGRDPLVVAAALEAAVLTVDKYAGRFFGTQGRTEYATINAQGVAPLRVQPLDGDPASIVSVAYRHTPTTLFLADAWSYQPPRNAAEAPALVVGTNANGVYDMTVRGLEPWARTSRLGRSGMVLAVTGVFGDGPVPPAVTTATCVLAAFSLGLALKVSDSEIAPGVSEDLAGVASLSVEGFSVSFSEPTKAHRGYNIHSTGVAQADRLLAPYVRHQRVVSWG